MTNIRIDDHHYLINWISSTNMGTVFFEVLYTNDGFLGMTLNSDNPLYFLNYTRKLSKISGRKFSEKRGGITINNENTSPWFLIEQLVRKHHTALIADTTVNC